MSVVPTTSQGTFSRNKNWSRSITNMSMSSSRSLMLRRRNGTNNNSAAQAATASGASGPNKGSLLSLNKTDGGGRPQQLHLPPTEQQLSPTQLSPQLSFSSIGGGGGRARASSTPSRAISLLNLFIPSSASSLSNQSQGFDKPEFAEGSCVDSYLISFLRKTAVVISSPTTIFCLLLCFGSNPTIKQLKNESAFSNIQQAFCTKKNEKAWKY